MRGIARLGIGVAHAIREPGGSTARRSDKTVPRTFQTRQIDDPPGLVRTFGTVVHTGTGPLRFEDRDACEHAHPSPPPRCAHGKVVAFSRNGARGEAVCYQLSDCRTHAHVVGCCNATAAAAALYAESSGRRHVRMRVHLPGGRAVPVEARVSRDAPGGGTAIEQTWRRVPFALHGETRIDGRTCVVCVGPLNNYLIIRPDPGEEPADLPVAEAVRLGERFGLAREPLLSRIAVVQPAGGAVPRARFLTCGEREHPSAPLTGLAVLALAAERLGWRDVQGAGRVQTRAGVMALPRISTRSKGVADVAFPELLVELALAPAHAAGGARR